MEVLLDVLKAVAEGRQKPTHVMCRANLHSKRLKKHLDFLVEQALLEETFDDETSSFTMTPKGKSVLGYFKNLESRLYHKNKIIPSEVYINHRKDGARTKALEIAILKR